MLTFVEHQVQSKLLGPIFDLLKSYFRPINLLRAHNSDLKQEARLRPIVRLISRMIM